WMKGAALHSFRISLMKMSETGRGEDVRDRRGEDVRVSVVKISETGRDEDIRDRAW
ncbi:hypothetical protein BgiBS90_026962, partial [Biomphalaria glabrata]